MSCLTAKEMVRQIRREEKFVRECQDRRDTLQKSLAEAEKAYSAAANALHKNREKACKGFASAILESLTFLELDHAVFQVELADAPEGPSGRDAVRFLFSSTGKAPQDLAKVASGGELSRIMLSLKAMMARYTAMPTLIFDEIDSGVSGSAADKMGSMICKMGESKPVSNLAVTIKNLSSESGLLNFSITFSCSSLVRL